MSQGESAGEASERDGQLRESRPETFRHLNTSHRHYNDPIAGINYVMEGRGDFSPPQFNEDIRSLPGQIFDDVTHGMAKGYDEIFNAAGFPRTEEVDLLSRHTTKALEFVGEFIPADAWKTLLPPNVGRAFNLLESGKKVISALGWAGDRLGDLGTWKHQSLSSLLPGPDYSISKAWDPGMHMELNDFHRTLEEMAPSADQVSDATAGLWDSVDELDGGVGALGGTMDLATLGMDGMSAAMVMGTQEAFTYTGQMGTLEDQALSTLDAFKLLAAAPPLPTGVGGSAGAWDPPPGVSAHTDPTESDPVEAEKQRILNMPPPANLEDLFLSQRELGHNISLYADAEAWWEAHKRELASNVPGYAGGTPYAPGGLALVGEIGPELVHLPRGSQVIPNPQLDNGVTVNVTVQGSVVAERDLAQRIRQELIRTSRRTVDLGFVS